ncbi:hypothetical protein BIW11_02947 [Tropilaelaps mercedesae]|uniref:Uncharacterized protein n=1 Tax=Tropilaelaps mercedesae TaxID=418985 RepID=A0A1V9XUR9_9ACAR|nr:hypothetical protein BIW11_02947 [Tropilaelaps mercedesae]
MLETMGSPGNPTMLEFYEALYLLERAKLRLTDSDGVPMSVFDAYATLLRDETDHELHLVFEHLVEGGCVVAPYKKPSKRKKPSARVNTEEEKLLMAAHALALPIASTQSAFAKDSDSDLEVISCNMPEPADKDKIPKEVELLYTPGPIYKGELISFLKISCAGQLLIVPTIPPELSPICAALQTCPAANGSGPLAGNHSSNVVILGRSLTVPEEWITMAGKERADPLDEATGEYRGNSTATRGRHRKRKGEWSSPKKGSVTKRGKKAKQQAVLEAPQVPEPFSGTSPAMTALPNAFDHLPGLGVMPNSCTERFHRRWFPRWFDGLELGVHSSSMQSNLHCFTRDGIPSIPWVRNWQEYKNEFARIVTERGSQTGDGADERIAFYRGTTKPLMTGTKGNMTALIFEELTLGTEVTEDLSTLLERFGRWEEDDSAENSGLTSQTDAAERLHAHDEDDVSAKGQHPTVGNNTDTSLSLINIKTETQNLDDDASREPPQTTMTVSYNGYFNGDPPSELTQSEVFNRVTRNETANLPEVPARKAAQPSIGSVSGEGDNANGQFDGLLVGTLKHTRQTQQDDASRIRRLAAGCTRTTAPRIVFDIYTDSDYSKTSSSLPDYRVVVLPSGAGGVLKFRDLIRLCTEADDTTLLIAHVVDGRVRTRQVMPFSIPRYN